MVASCCRFLCYFCRISRHNQRALFDHLTYLLENSSVGLGDSPPPPKKKKPSGGCVCVCVHVQVKVETTALDFNWPGL